MLLDILAILEGLQKRKLASIIAAATSSRALVTAESRIERMKVLHTLTLSSDHLYALPVSLSFLSAFLVIHMNSIWNCVYIQYRLILG